MNSKEENSENFSPNYVYEFGLGQISVSFAAFLASSTAKKGIQIPVNSVAWLYRGYNGSLYFHNVMAFKLRLKDLCNKITFYFLQKNCYDPFFEHVHAQFAY